MPSAALETASLANVGGLRLPLSPQALLGLRRRFPPSVQVMLPRLVHQHLVPARTVQAPTALVATRTSTFAMGLMSTTDTAALLPGTAARSSGTATVYRDGQCPSAPSLPSFLPSFTSSHVMLTENNSQSEYGLCDETVVETTSVSASSTPIAN